MEIRNPLIKWITENARLSAWVVLSLGMIILLVIEAHDVGLTVGNWIALIVATVLVAGACVWIVSWEDGDDSATPTDTGTFPQVPTPSDDSPTPTLETSKTPDEVLQK